MSKNFLIIVGIILVVIIVGGVIFISQREEQHMEQPTPLVPPLQKEESESLGGQISDEVSPAEKLPETNPFDAIANPFEEAKTNPFEGGYKNPFEK